MTNVSGGYPYIRYTPDLHDGRSKRSAHGYNGEQEISRSSAAETARKGGLVSPTGRPEPDERYSDTCPHFVCRQLARNSAGSKTALARIRGRRAISQAPWGLLGESPKMSRAWFALRFRIASESQSEPGSGQAADTVQHLPQCPAIHSLMGEWGNGI